MTGQICVICKNSFESARGLTQHQRKNGHCRRLLREKLNAKHGVLSAYQGIQLTAPIGATRPPRFTITYNHNDGKVATHKDAELGYLPCETGTETSKFPITATQQPPTAQLDNDDSNNGMIWDYEDDASMEDVGDNTEQANTNDGPNMEMVQEFREYTAQRVGIMAMPTVYRAAIELLC